MSDAMYVQTLESAVVIALHDPWEAGSGEKIVAELLACAFTSRPRDVLVDLESVQRLPSAIIGGLISLQLQLTRDGRQLVLMRVSTELRNHLARLHLERVFAVRESLMEAVRWLDSREFCTGSDKMRGILP